MRYSIVKTVGIVLCCIATVTQVNAAQTCKTDSISLSRDWSEFEQNMDGTVTDTRTGLIWASCLQGLSGLDCTSGAVNAYSWSAALALTQPTSVSSPAAGWRLPNVRELSTILERACHSPATHNGIFPNTSSELWTSSPDAYDAGLAQAISFNFGSINPADRRAALFVRLVRSSQ